MPTSAPVNIGDAFGRTLTGLSQQIVPYMQQKKLQEQQAIQLENKRFNDEFRRSYQMTQLKNESRRQDFAEEKFASDLDFKNIDLGLKQDKLTNDPDYILGQMINTELAKGSLSIEDAYRYANPSLVNTEKRISAATEKEAIKQEKKDVGFETKTLTSFTTNLNKKATSTRSARDKAVTAERKKFDSDDDILARILTGDESSGFNFSREQEFADRAVGDTTSAMNEFATRLAPIRDTDPEMYNRLLEALTSTVGAERVDAFNATATQGQDVDASAPIWETYGYRDANHMLGDLEQDYQNGDISKEKYLEWKNKLGL